jgi:hypothetical protein
MIVPVQSDASRRLANPVCCPTMGLGETGSQCKGQRTALELSESIAVSKSVNHRRRFEATKRS